jgi:iron-sulfur cluster assembly protein CyaY
MSLPEREYEERALPELQSLVAALDALDSDAFEAELSSDVLSIEFTDGDKYVINSHRAARQIWMAAQRSAWHFAWDPEKNRWIASKTGDELWQAVERVLSEKLGQPVILEHP